MTTPAHSQCPSHFAMPTPVTVTLTTYWKWKENNLLMKEWRKWECKQNQAVWIFLRHKFIDKLPCKVIYVKTPWKVGKLVSRWSLDKYFGKNNELFTIIHCVDFEPVTLFCSNWKKVYYCLLSKVRYLKLNKIKKNAPHHRAPVTNPTDFTGVHRGSQGWLTSS